MISGWRSAFQTPALPFVYVELCTEYGAQEPQESDFWMAQRSALTLPATGFATTTDIQRALHPPNKQAVAERLLLEVRRLTGNAAGVSSRGPELLSKTFDDGKLTLRFSNESLHVRAGIQVPPPAGGGCTLGPAAGPHDTASSSAVQQVGHGGQRVQVPFAMHGSTMVVSCSPGNETTPVLINSDTASCFLYASAGLPAPPLSVACAP
jgi:hypothetical protein